MDFAGAKMSVERFNGNNFRQWKFQMKCALRAKGIDISKRRPTDVDSSDSEWLKNDGMAMFIMTSAMDYKQIALIENCDSAAKIMEKLESIYEQKSEFNKMLIHERFYQYKMNPSDSMAQHIAKVESLAQQLKDSGEEISDMAIITKIISTLPSKYRSLRQAWMSLSASQQTIHNLTARLMDEEASLTEEEEQEVALMAAQEVKKTGSSDTLNKEKPRHRFVCYNCNKHGHFAKQCRAKKFNKQHKEESNVHAFHTVGDLCDVDDTYNDVWLLDSGATVHMTFRKDFYLNFEPYSDDSNRVVKLSNQQNLKVCGVGTVVIKKYVDGQWEQNILNEVIYVPELRRNLFSEGTIMRLGYVIVKKNVSALVYKDNKVVLSATQNINNLYEMNFKTVTNVSCNTVQNVSENSLKVWHERLGHLNIQEVKNMVKSGLIKCKDVEDDKFVCEACMYGKQSQFPFHTLAQGVLSPGDLVYSDVCGPMSESSIQGMKFFVVFKDAASSFLCVYYMRHKSELLNHFKTYNAIIQNKFGHSVRILHTSNDKEYVNDDFKGYLNRNKIVHEWYTPQQSGRAEKELCTIVESARTMLYGRSLPLNLWAEAVGCAVYLLNRTTSSKSLNKSPYEVWCGQKPNIQHLQVFGSCGYVHVPDACRTKLEKKSNKMILVGYDNQNYRMYDMNTNKIKISRDVVFDESSYTPITENPAVIDIGEPCCKEVSEGRVPVVTSTRLSSQSQAEDTVRGDSLKTCINEDGDGNYKTRKEMKDTSNVLNMNLRPRINRRKYYDANMTEYSEPSAYQEEISSPESIKQDVKIVEELKARADDKTWTIFDNNIEKTKETMFMGACDVRKERLLRKQFVLYLKPQYGIHLFVDNQAAIKLKKYPVYHRKSRNVNIKYTFICKKVEPG